MEQELGELGYTKVYTINAGKTNTVFLVKNKEGQRYIFKLYSTKYRDKPDQYERDMLHFLKEKIPVPKVIAYGQLSGKPYNVIEYIGKVNLTEKCNSSYLEKLLCLIKKIHTIENSPGKHRFSKDPDAMLKYVLNKLSADQKKELEYLTRLPTTSKCLCHRDPNFKHVHLVDGEVIIVDWEDAHIMPVEIDYASIVKDLIDYNYDNTLLEMVKQACPTDEKTLVSYVIRLYILDNYFAHNSPRKVSVEQLIRLRNTSTLFELKQKIHDSLQCNGGNQ